MWTRPLWWTLLNAAAIPVARRKKVCSSIGGASSKSHERLAARILKDYHGLTGIPDQFNRPRGPLSVQLVLQACSCERSSRLVYVGRSVAGRIANTVPELCSARQARSAKNSFTVSPQHLQGAVTINTRRNQWVHVPPISSSRRDDIASPMATLSTTGTVN